MSSIKVSRHPLLVSAYELMVRQQNPEDYAAAKKLLIGLDELLGLPGAPIMQEQEVRDGGESQPKVGGLKVEVDTSDFWKGALEAGAVFSSVGQLSHVALDPVESAIQSTVSMMRDELQASGATPDQFPVGAYARLDAHLDELLRMQIDRLGK